MLFEQRFWEPIARGEVTVTFRRWKRRQALAGNRYRTAAAIIEADAVDIVTVDDITDADARAGGYPTVDGAGRPTCAARPTSTSTGSGSTSSTSPTRAPARWPTRRSATRTVAEIDRRLDRLDGPAATGRGRADTLRLIERHARRSGPATWPTRSAGSGCRSRPTCASSRTSASRSASASATELSPRGAGLPRPALSAVRLRRSPGEREGRRRGTSPARPTSQHASGAGGALRRVGGDARPGRAGVATVAVVGRLDAEAGGEGGDPLGAGAVIVGHRPRPYAGPMADDPSRVRVSPTLVIPASELSWRFSRSGGPGGQHANTADTRVEVRFDIAGSPSLGPAPAGPAARAAGRRGAGGRLRRALAGPQPRPGARAAAASGWRRRCGSTPPRRPTKPTQASVQRRLEAKRRQADRKADRRRPHAE